MERGINESDWKLFRQLQPLALDRFCQRVLAEVSRLTGAFSSAVVSRLTAFFEQAIF